MSPRLRDMLTYEEIERLKTALDKGAFELSQVTERSVFSPPKTERPVRKLVFGLAKEGHPFFVNWLKEHYNLRVFTDEELEVLNDARKEYNGEPNYLGGGSRLSRQDGD